MSVELGASEFELVAELLKPFLVAVMRDLATQYGETPLEAGEHLQGIIKSGARPIEQQRMPSLYELATFIPVLRDELLSGKTHKAVARRWGVNEASVRRARDGLRDENLG